VLVVGVIGDVPFYGALVEVRDPDIDIPATRRLCDIDVPVTSTPM
jgi:hypothetical protein